GIRNEDLEQTAIEIAREIGKVQVDHGATSCKTPDAESYIKKARERAEKKKMK
ncbi:TPA: DNA alkylation repair protein, partial [Bacillus anthracis]|nr:DNA alkylation repair protein [Bacillus anthracis]